MKFSTFLVVLSYCIYLTASEESKYVSLHSNVSLSKKDTQTAKRPKIFEIADSESESGSDSDLDGQRKIDHISQNNAISEHDASKFFERRNLNAILEEARTNKTLAAIVCDEFRQELVSKTIVFYSPLSTQIGYVSNSSILISDYKLFASLMSVVGHLVENLEIRYNKISADQRLLIHYLLKKFCSKSLITFKMSQCDQHVLTTFDSSLKSVQNLIISGDLSTKPFFIRGFLYSRETMGLGEIFPKIRQLTIEHMFVSDPSVFQHKFPELTDVKIIFFPSPVIHVWKNYYYKTKPAMKNLFDYNPQIRSLSLSNCNSLDYLKIANDRLERLAYLQVNLLTLKEKYPSKPINFHWVKGVEMTTETSIDFNVLRFPRVEEMRLTCTANDCGAFPFHSNTLTQLTISGYSFENRNSMMLRHAPFLTDLTIMNDSKINADFIFAYIEPNKYLMNVKFVNYNETFYNELKQYDIQGWQLKRQNSVLILEYMDK